MSTATYRDDASRWSDDVQLAQRAAEAKGCDRLALAALVPCYLWIVMFHPALEAA